MLLFLHRWFIPMNFQWNEVNFMLFYYTCTLLFACVFRLYGEKGLSPTMHVTSFESPLVACKEEIFPLTCVLQLHHGNEMYDGRIGSSKGSKYQLRGTDKKIASCEA